MRRGVRMYVLKRVVANRQRIEEARQSEEREAAAIRAPKEQKATKEKEQGK
jgi:hypothetical protein